MTCKRKPVNEVGEKECTNCFEWKPLDDFYAKGFFKDGTQRYQSRCKKCQPEVVAGYSSKRGLPMSREDLSPPPNRVGARAEKVEADYL